MAGHLLEAVLWNVADTPHAVDYPTIPNGFQCKVMENNAKAGLDLKMLAVFVATLDARHALNEGFWFGK